MGRKRLRGVVLGGALCLALGVSMHAFTQTDSGDPARHIAELTNHDRADRELQPLRWDASLAAAAQAHAERMAEVNYLSHQYPGEQDLGARAAQAGAHFQAIAENIATGPSDDAVESEWMHSTPHRTNILDPRMNAIGVGVVERHGTIYAVEDFAASSAALSSAEVERKVGDLLRREDVDPTAPRDAAAQACESANGYPQGGTGKLVVRFDTPDLSQLPSGIAAQIRRGGYRKASVAKCAGGQQGNFTTYRVAIVLY